MLLQKSNQITTITMIHKWLNTKSTQLYQKQNLYMYLYVFTINILGKF